MKELLGFNIFEESVIGTGIDFWMGKGTYNEEEIAYFQRKARLEISGLGKEKIGNTVGMRVTKKKKQIKASDDTQLDGWIVIVEFSTPKTKIIKK